MPTLPNMTSLSRLTSKFLLFIQRDHNRPVDGVARSVNPGRAVIEPYFTLDVFGVLLRGGHLRAVADIP